MNCLHPFTRRYLDALTGQEKQIVCPCGKCINCLHREQDSWTVRLTESARYHRRMIFDTLTVSPIAMPYIDMLDGLNLSFKKPQSYDKFRDMLVKSYDIAHEFYPNMSLESWKIISKNGGRLLYFPKSEVQDWLKRGRMAMNRDYLKEGKTPPKWEYFLVQEYGCKTSRPHFHVLVFGLSLNDWFHYFGRPWRDLYGFTRHVYKEFNPESQKDFNCMIKYVSKYITKGEFELPLVKDGLYQKPYRLISKGIGSHYLDNKKFDVFRTAVANKYKSMVYTTYNKYKEAEEDYKAYVEWSRSQYVPHYGDISPEQLFVEECCEYLAPISCPMLEGLDARYRDIQSNLIALDKDPDFSVTEDDLQKLCVYYDSAGYPHALPNYYRYKILKNSNSNETNIYSYKVQTLLQQSAELRDNQSISSYATSLGYNIAPGDIHREKGSIEGLSPWQAFVVLNGYTVAERREAKARSERHFARLNNFYNRPKYNNNQNLT